MQLNMLNVMHSGGGIQNNNDSINKNVIIILVVIVLMLILLLTYRVVITKNKEQCMLLLNKTKQCVPTIEPKTHPPYNNTITYNINTSDDIFKQFLEYIKPKQIKQIEDSRLSEFTNKSLMMKNHQPLPVKKQFTLSDKKEYPLLT
jgi:hypothetical protein